MSAHCRMWIFVWTWLAATTPGVRVHAREVEPLRENKISRVVMTSLETLQQILFSREIKNKDLTRDQEVGLPRRRTAPAHFFRPSQRQLRLFFCPFTRAADARRPASNDSLCQELTRQAPFSILNDPRRPTGRLHAPEI